MKKYLIFFLAFLFLLTACGETVSDISEELTSSDENGVSDEGSKEDENTPTRSTLVSRGKPYTKTVTANEKYPDKYHRQDSRIQERDLSPNMLHIRRRS